MTNEQEARLRKHFGVNDQYEMLKVIFDEIMAKPVIEPITLKEVQAKKAPRVNKSKVCGKNGRMKQDAEICSCES